MIKHIKSITLWYYIFKFKLKLAMILFLVLSLMFSQWIYSDVLEYLKLTKQTDLIGYALAIKWLYILSAIVFVVFLVSSIIKQISWPKFFSTRTNPESGKSSSTQEEKVWTDREKKFLEKEKLRSKAEILLDK